MMTAAVSAGLAISAFSCRLAPPGTMEVSQRFGLPPLPSTEIVMFSTLTDVKSREALRTLAAAFRDHRPGLYTEKRIGCPTRSTSALVGEHNFRPLNRRWYRP